MTWKMAPREFTAKVISGGRITIPYEIRQLKNIKKGEMVKVIIDTED